MLLHLVKYLFRTTAFYELAKISVLSITLQPVQFGFFTVPSTIVPSFHRLNVRIFTLLKPLASFLYATWSSATFLASCNEPWTSGIFNTLIVAITLQPVGLGLFTAPLTIVPSLHRLKPSIFKIFKRLDSFSYATWSSATFLTSCSEPRTCGNFNTLIVSITLHHARFGFFKGPSSIVPSLHRQKICIFTLFTSLALISYATWFSTTFLASYSEPWIHGSFYYKHSCLYDLDFSHIHLRFYLCCTDGWLVFLNSLHLYLHSHMLLDLVQPFLRDEVSLEYAEISIRQWFLIRYSL